MTPDRLEAVKQELSIIRRGGQDPMGRYVELMREVRESATPEQSAEIRAALLGEPCPAPPEQERPGRPPFLSATIAELVARMQPPGECQCPKCTGKRCRESVRESALRLMCERGDTPEQAVAAAYALERLLAGIPDA